MKLGIILVGGKNSGKTTTLRLVKNALGLGEERKFPCDDNSEGWIVIHGKEELKKDQNGNRGPGLLGQAVCPI